MDTYVVCILTGWWLLEGLLAAGVLRRRWWVVRGMCMVCAWQGMSWAGMSSE